MNNKVLLVGTRSDAVKNRFTGQSVLFDGILESTKNYGYDTVVLDISSRLGNHTIYRIMDYFVILLKFISLLCAGKFCLVYLVSSQSKRGFYRDFCMVLLCRLFRVKIITHQYGANYNQMLDSMTEIELYFLKHMISYISNIIVEGEYMKMQFSFYEGYNDKVLVIPNGLPNEGENIGIAKTYCKDEPFTLLYLSNLIYSKGYFDVLKAVEHLVNYHKLNVKCIFAGQFMGATDDVYSNISNKANFDNYIMEHNLSEYVKYFPGLYGKEKDYYFYKSKAFILPTYYINEGQPVSILEAMSYGCVPIVTKFRHIPMMVNDENGCFVDSASPESICSAVITLMNSPEVYNGKSIRAIDDYMRKYKFDIFSSKVLNIMNKIIDK